MEIDPVILALIGRQALTIEVLTGQLKRVKAELEAARAASASDEDAEG